MLVNDKMKSDINLSTYEKINQGNNTSLPKLNVFFTLGIVKALKCYIGASLTKGTA